MLSRPAANRAAFLSSYHAGIVRRPSTAGRAAVGSEAAAGSAAAGAATAAFFAVASAGGAVLLLLKLHLLHTWLFLLVSDYVCDVMSSFNACNVTVRDRWEGWERGGEIQG